MEGLLGIASGIDTATIVSQLMAIERRSGTRLQLRQSAVQGQQAAIKSIATKLTALKDAAAALREPATWKAVQSVSSSNTSAVSVTATGGAGIGEHAVQVDRLASSAHRS